MNRVVQFVAKGGCTTGSHQTVPAFHVFSDFDCTLSRLEHEANLIDGEAMPLAGEDALLLVPLNIRFRDRATSLIPGNARPGRVEANRRSLIPPIKGGAKAFLQLGSPTGANMLGLHRRHVTLQPEGLLVVEPGKEIAGTQTLDGDDRHCMSLGL